MFYNGWKDINYVITVNMISRILRNLFTITLPRSNSWVFELNERTGMLRIYLWISCHRVVRALRIPLNAGPLATVIGNRCRSSRFEIQFCQGRTRFLENANKNSIIRTISIQYFSHFNNNILILYVCCNFCKVKLTTRRDVSPKKKVIIIKFINRIKIEICSFLKFNLHTNPL